MGLSSTYSCLVEDRNAEMVIIEGIGIFSMCLGETFASCGFLHSSLYVLLENLYNLLKLTNLQIRSASDAVLHVVSSTCGYPTVGHLVLANSDYVIDSICHQLSRLYLNPHVPNVHAAMLSYIGLAHNILPLLEELMRSVSLELEILGCHQHPDLTVPFLKVLHSGELLYNVRLVGSKYVISYSSTGVDLLKLQRLQIEKRAHCSLKQCHFLKM
ncbi:hypothetical protein RHGRI_024361 [Rhododendron griersonianum]|uniref:Uncharacterized protein n=1 Tax=Rhododendron griersonianum TaxID=479676 RepID=A0AAV6J991_9ERIC|nr:hypothetical protein RHGRI_024361 [Rhododendron griersonianum]